VGEAPIGAGFSPDGQKLAVGHWGGTILLDLRSPLGTQALELKPYDTHWGFVPVFHPRRPWLLVSGTMGAVVAWPLDREYPLHFPDIPFAYSLAFTPDGKRLLMAKDGAILLFPLSGDPEDPPRPVLQLEQNSFNSLQLDAEGRFVLSGIGNSPAGNHSFHLVDLETGVHRSWKEHWFWSAAAKLHPQAKYIAVPNDFTVQGERNLCRILDLRDDSFVDVEFGDEDPVVPWGFDREGFLLLGHAEQIHRVDPSDGTRELLIDGVHRGFQSGYESADRRWLVWRSTTDSLRLTDLESGETRPLELGGHHGSPIGIDPAGRFLALAQGGGVMDIVALDGSLQHRLHGPEGSYTSVAFDPTGHWIAASTTAESDAVRLWRMPHGNSPDWLPREELLELLRPQTSLRVEPDEESPVRYRIVAGEFPGWDPPPTW
jgi:WD40 repeat protein